MAAMLVASLYLYKSAPLSANSLTHIYVLDVGQGDSILIRTAQQENILIDGGPSASVLSELKSLLPPWDQTIDLMLLTHPHADHLVGLESVASQLPVKNFWYSGSEYDTNLYKSLLEEIAARGIPATFVSAGAVQEFAGSTLRVLAPASIHPASSDPNETSVVSVFTQGNFDLLLTGDMTSKNEANLVAANLVPDVEVLKVPHHGSRESSSDPFLEAASPELGLISLGKDNSYGHPHPEALDRYLAHRIPVLRTDLLGTIHLLTDGFTYKVATDYE